MSIHFSEADWQRVRSVHERWWKGELERPLVHLSAEWSRDPRPEKPRYLRLSQAEYRDESIDPDDIIDSIDYSLDHMAFLGDAFPVAHIGSFGRALTGEFCGGQAPDPSSNSIFYSGSILPLEQVSFRYDPDCAPVRRLKSLYRAGARRWHGNVLMTLPNLGSTLDMIASFIGTTALFDAITHCPDQVKRLTGEAHAALMEAYWDFVDLLKELGNPGFACWDYTFSSEPCMLITCPPASVFPPELFSEFVLDDLKQYCTEVPHTTYDVASNIQCLFLEQLLSIKNLNGIRWTPKLYDYEYLQSIDAHPDRYNPGADCWQALQRKISESGKLCEVVYGGSYFTEAYRICPRNLMFREHSWDLQEAKGFINFFSERFGLSFD